ncbi:MAG: zinc ribbon domain-containing protein [Candidatus Methanomethylophilaceae archaeon]|nr:zinc ribbon domain-containing protein [Candidatus Methanomethylophilaceae archaeon]MDD3379204.1 zinc ribbon domain-containing protein [Candidatus Methanomethylophilaceae archaeon]MDY0223804.1 zinc ribbon domain-containing protein [Candidatus Methanomethylophilaceae archaeon]
MNKNCPNCDQPLKNNARFCTFCGFDTNSSVTQHQKEYFLDFSNNPLFSLAFLSCIIMVFILLTEALCLVLNLENVFGLLETMNISFIVVLPTPTVFFTAPNWLGQIYWVLIVIVILVCLIWAIKKFYDNLKTAITDNSDAMMERTGLFWVCILMTGMLTIQITYIVIIFFFGITIDTSWMDKYTQTELMYMLADAAVWEEIITRVLYIGVPVMIISLVIKKDKSSWRYLFGGFKMTKIAIVFIIFSAIMFGLAHNQGWGSGKIFIAALMGLAEGYLFVRFGLYASILLHFANDYLSSFIWLGMGTAISGSITLLIVFAGIPAAIYFIYKFLHSAKGLKDLPILSDRFEKN